MYLYIVVVVIIIIIHIKRFIFKLTINWNLCLDTLT